MPTTNGKAAEGKRLQISKAQQLTMLEVLGASLVLGACIVLSIFLIKYIKFNTKVISAKDKSIASYNESILNVGICADKDKNGRLSDKELKDCNPNTTALNDVQNSLRYNVLENLAVNEHLESVARQRTSDCYDEQGERIDFAKLYNSSKNDAERQRNSQMRKICSALRVIPDALPAQKNTEALMASLNQIFILSGWEPETLQPRNDSETSNIEGLGVIPVNLRVEGSAPVVLTTLDNIEKSIREFDISTANVEWTNTGISLQASADAFYLINNDSFETTETVYASDKAGKAKK